MKSRAQPTGFCPVPTGLHAGMLTGNAVRHTVRPQGTKDWLLIYTLGGLGLYRFPGGEYLTRIHEVTLYRPKAFQDYQFDPAVERWDLLYAHFLVKSDWPPLLDWPEISPGLMRLEIKEPALRHRIIARLRDAIRFNGSGRARGQALGLNALEEALLWCDSVNPRRAEPDPRVGKAIEYLSTHLNEPFSEEATARAAGLSPSRLRHLFREQAGDSPRSFHEQQRLRRARELLALSRQSIGEIADELGFSNPFYFTLRFKKSAGESPRAFRQRVMQR